MSLHKCLGHADIATLQQWAKGNKFPTEPASIKNCPLPRCSRCLFAKAQCKSWCSRTEPAGIRATSPTPGSTVHVDQLEVTMPGLLPQLKGKLQHSKYTCATIFINEFSGKDFVYCQTKMDTKQTLESKAHYEQQFWEHVVTIQHYHGDNGQFYDDEFCKSCLEAHQKLTFCGVNAHHQNGIAENHIRMLSHMSRSIILHAMLCWRWISLHLWPFAMQHASYLNNHLPGKDGLSKTEVFCKIQSPIEMKNLHIFGCPAYVLVKPLQSSNSVPCFHCRTRVGIYVGHSPQHAGNVALILNPQTGCTSPQDHVVFEDNFTTVNDIKNSLTPSTWQQLVSKYEGASKVDYDLAKLWFNRSNVHDLRVPPDGGNMDAQQDKQPLVALQVTEHNNVEQISSLMLLTKPPPKDDTGRAQATAP
jgi:hypothetical protein